MAADGRRRFRLRDMSARQIAIVAAAWIVLMGVALGLALGLDQPVGSGARDRATPIVAGPVVAPGQELTATGEGLPPLALVLPQSPPASVANLPPPEQVARLRQRADAQPSPRRLVELGSALQATSDNPSAEDAYRAALRRDPQNVPARIGLVMTDAASSSEGLDRGGRALARLGGELPDSQVVAFNEGWLAIYRRDPETAASAWTRTIALDGQNRLGRTARQLLEALRMGAQPAGP